MELLIEFIGQQPAVIVLDNCEHLVEASADVARQMLSRCPQLRVIATSRAGLGIQGEQIYHVPALSYPPDERFKTWAASDLVGFESVRLFVERAKLARADFAITDEAAPILADICRRLEGIPLAIELAAARVRAMPLDQISARLFEVLDPQCVLESSIKWSVQLLNKAERTLLGRLSVFRGGWTLEAAEAVCGDGETKKIGKASVVKLLESLVDQSLVLYEERDARPRYHMLETVRECQPKTYSEPSDLNLSFARYFSALAQDAELNLDQGAQIGWLNRLEVESDNLRLALQIAMEHLKADDAAKLACALDVFWCVRGRVDEGRAWTSQALEKRKGRRDLLQLKLLNTAGIMAGRHGDVDAAKTLCSEALGIANELNDDVRAAGISTNIGLWERDRGDLSSSAEWHSEAMSRSAKCGDVLGRARAELHLADVLKQQKCFDESKRHLDSCLHIFREKNDRQRIAGTLHHLGEIHYWHNRHEMAHECLIEAIEIRTQLADARAFAASALWMAANCLHHGQRAKAVEMFAIVNQRLCQGTKLSEYDRRMFDYVKERLCCSSGP
jgi:predicted ATPase